MISGTESLSFLLIDPKEGSYFSSPCSLWCNQTQIYLVFLILSLIISKKVVYSLQHFPNRTWEFNAWNMCSIIQSFPIFSTVFDSSLINKAFSANSKIVPAKISFFLKGYKMKYFLGISCQSYQQVLVSFTGISTWQQTSKKLEVKRISDLIALSWNNPELATGFYKTLLTMIPFHWSYLLDIYFTLYDQYWSQNFMKSKRQQHMYIIRIIHLNIQKLHQSQQLLSSRDIV